MSQLYIVNNVRRSAFWLQRNGLSKDTSGVYPLENNIPAYNPSTHYIADGGTGGDPQSGYYIDWIVENLSDEEIKKNLPQIKAAKLDEMINGSNEAALSIKKKYSQLEIGSWPQQEAEARAFLSDADAPAPLLHKLAAQDGVSPVELAKRIVTNADAAAVAAESIILQQKTMEKTLKAADSLEAVQAVSVSYSLE